MSSRSSKSSESLDLGEDSGEEPVPTAFKELFASLGSKVLHVGPKTRVVGPKTKVYPLGEGTYGQVYNIKGHAFKLYTGNPKDTPLVRISASRAAYHEECEILQALKNMDFMVPTTLGSVVFGDKQLNSIRMPIGTPLDKYAKDLTKGELIALITELHRLVDCIHEAGWVFHDCKLENIILLHKGDTGDGLHIVVCDPGAVCLEEAERTTLDGGVNYVPRSSLPSTPDIFTPAATWHGYAFMVLCLLDNGAFWNKLDEYTRTQDGRSFDLHKTTTKMWEHHKGRICDLARGFLNEWLTANKVDSVEISLVLANLETWIAPATQSTPDRRPVTYSSGSSKRLKLMK